MLRSAYNGISVCVKSFDTQFIVSHYNPIATVSFLSACDSLCELGNIFYSIFTSYYTYVINCKKSWSVVKELATMFFFIYIKPS